MAQRVAINIEIDGDVEAAVVAARDLGYVETRRLDLVPVSSGDVPEDRLDELKAIPGVVNVEIDRISAAYGSH
jgi:hypothetical protein